MNLGKKVAIIGAGNLGIAIAKGLVKKELYEPSSIYLTKRRIGLINHMIEEGYQVTDDNKKAVKEATVIFLCVQPKQLEGVLTKLSGLLTEQHVLVSVITGVKIAQIKSYLSFNLPVVRTMPNTAIAIGESMTCLCACELGQDYLKPIQTLFETVGTTMLINEQMMKAATVLGASGTAFVMRYLRAATQGGIQMGFHPEEAQLIAVQTAFGAAKLIKENNSHPEAEIDKVTTPQGCTIAGLNQMEHSGFSSALIKGLMVSFDRINGIQEK